MQHPGSASVRRRRVTRRKAEGAFTLVELLIVLMIIAMLFAIIIPNFLKAKFNAELSACEENENSIAKGLEVYFVENQAYPAALDAAFCSTFVGTVPTCPLSHGSYSYQLNAVAQTYTIVCTAPHSEVNVGVSAGYPQYNHNAGGLQLYP